MASQSSNKYWYFMILARDIEPQYTGDDEYISPHYNSFADCIRAYRSFNTRARWPDVLVIRSEYLVYNDGVTEHRNAMQDGGMIYIPWEWKEEYGISHHEYVDAFVHSAELVINQNS
jgi:hypothetical protein